MDAGLVPALKDEFSPKSEQLKQGDKMQVEMRMKTEDTNVTRKFNTKKAAIRFFEKHKAQIIEAKLFVYDGQWNLSKELK